jgi:glycosyltransferase involved in cell wall biosynthesis
MELASGDIIIIHDGDLEYDPADNERVLEPIVRGDCDVVYGSRFLGQITGMKWQYRIANRILARTANLLYGAAISDEATAYNALRTSIARQLDLQCRGFEFCSGLTAKLC